jgi:hypothetical protein
MSLKLSTSEVPVCVTVVVVGVVASTTTAAWAGWLTVGPCRFFVFACRSSQRKLRCVYTDLDRVLPSLLRYES